MIGAPGALPAAALSRAVAGPALSLTAPTRSAAILTTPAKGIDANLVARAGGQVIPESGLAKAAIVKQAEESR